MRAFDWDDLRFALAVASGGSLAAGGRLLGVNHTTVLRRIAGLEKRLGARLFERLPSGYALTPLGEELVGPRAASTQASTARAEACRRRRRRVGRGQVTTTDTLAVPLPEICRARARIRHRIERTQPVPQSDRREADVAIRPADDPPPTLFGRRIASVGFAVYGRRDRFAKPLPFAELVRHPFVAPDDSLSATAAARWIASVLPDATIAARADSFVTLAAIAEAGLGLAVLPCYLGDRSQKLVRLSRPIEAMRTGLWLLTHEQLRRTARIRAVLEFVGTALAKRRKAIEG